MKKNDDCLNISFGHHGKARFIFVLVLFLASCTPPASSSSVSSSRVSTPVSSSISMTSYSTSITGDTVFTLGAIGNYLSNETNDTELDVYSIEMHDEYGDATLVDYGNYEILIDGGYQTDGPYVKAMLTEYVTDGILDLLVVTHAHMDHYGGLVSASTWSTITSIAAIVDYGYVGGNTYASMRNSFVSEGSEYHPITELLMHSDGLYHVSEKMSVRFLNTNTYVAPGGTASDPNTTSICLIITFGNTVFYFNGDSTGTTDTGVRYNYPGLLNDTQVVIAKGAHHASNTNGSNSSTFLRLFLKPDYVFISAAIKDVNRTSDGLVEDQHPHYAAVARFAVLTDQIYWNGINGTLDIHSDGIGITISGKERTVDYYVGGLAVDRANEKDLTLLQSEWYLHYLLA